MNPYPKLYKHTIPSGLLPQPEFFTGFLDSSMTKEFCVAPLGLGFDYSALATKIWLLRSL